MKNSSRKSKKVLHPLLICTIAGFLFFLLGTPWGLKILGIGAQVQLMNIPAHEFSVMTPEGEKVEIKKGGGAIFLVFFSLHCPSCMAELSLLKNMKEKFPQDITAIAINVDGKGVVDTLKKFIEEEGIWFKVGVDEDGGISAKYGVASLPSSFIIDRNFIIRLRFVGPILDEEDLLKKLGEINAY